VQTIYNLAALSDIITSIPKPYLILLSLKDQLSNSLLLCDYKNANLSSCVTEVSSISNWRASMISERVDLGETLLTAN